MQKKHISHHPQFFRDAFQRPLINRTCQESLKGASRGGWPLRAVHGPSAYLPTSAPQNCEGVVSECNRPNETMLFAVDKHPPGCTCGGKHGDAGTGNTRKDVCGTGKTVGDCDREGQPGPRKLMARNHTSASEGLNTKGQSGCGLGLGFFQSE